MDAIICRGANCLRFSNSKAIRPLCPGGPYAPANTVAQTTWPDIMHATHQIAKYSSDPRQSHGEAILYLVCYLKKSRNLGFKFEPDPKKGFEYYSDVDFLGNWNREFAPVDPSTTKL